MIMRWHAFTKGTKPPQEIKLLVTKPGDVGDGFRPRDHRHKTQQQHLIQRIPYLRTLPTIRQILEMTQKNNRFRQCTGIASQTVHRDHPLRIK